VKKTRRIILKKKLSLLLILLFALTLSACIFNQSVGDEKERVAAEEELIQLFKDYGFKGKVSVENATGKTFETSIYSANVTYVEDLNGQELSFGQTLGYGEKPEDKSPEATASVESLVETFYSIADEAMWRQPEGVKISQAVDEFVEKFHLDNLIYEGFRGQIDTTSSQIVEFYTLVDGNRKKDKPLQGLYDIPIKDMMSKEVVIGQIDFHLEKASDEISDQMTQENDAKQALMTYVQNADLSQFPDGKYGIGFDLTTESGTYYNSVSDYFFFFVKDGRFISIDKDYHY
jgi:hypothetical protein